MSVIRPSSRRSINSFHDDSDFPLIDNLPGHWNLLTRSDLDEYVKLRKSFYDEIRKSKKGERLDAFIQRILKIKNFVERGDGDDWKRGLVCGIIFLPNSIAIHIQQFRLLLGKCKSSINGSLQAIGFAAHPQGGPIETELLMKVPIFQKEHSEVKKWTVRDCTVAVNPLISTNSTIKEQQINKAFPEPLINKTSFSPYLQDSNLNISNNQINVDIGKECIEPKPRPFYNVPIKFRAKFYSLIHQSIAVQTDI